MHRPDIDVPHDGRLRLRRVTEPAATLRDSTTIGPYQVEVWEEPPGAYAGLFKVEVLKAGRLVRGPYRYIWLDQAVEVATNMAALIRERVQVPGG